MEEQQCPLASDLGKIKGQSPSGNPEQHHHGIMCSLTHCQHFLKNLLKFDFIFLSYFGESRMTD